jgi:hypothetical protein
MKLPKPCLPISDSDFRIRTPISDSVGLPTRTSDFGIGPSTTYPRPPASALPVSRPPFGAVSARIAAGVRGLAGIVGGATTLPPLVAMVVFDHLEPCLPVGPLACAGRPRGAGATDPRLIGVTAQRPTPGEFAYRADGSGATPGIVDTAHVVPCAKGLRPWLGAEPGHGGEKTADDAGPGIGAENVPDSLRVVGLGGVASGVRTPQTRILPTIARSEATLRHGRSDPKASEEGAGEEEAGESDSHRGGS